MEEKFSLGPGGFGWTEVPVTLGVWGETGDLCAGSPVRNDRAPTQGGVRVGTAHQVRQLALCHSLGEEPGQSCTGLGCQILTRGPAGVSPMEETLIACEELKAKIPTQETMEQ